MSLVNFQFISCCASARGVGEGTSSAYTGGGGAEHRLKGVPFLTEVSERVGKSVIYGDYCMSFNSYDVCEFFWI